MGQLKQRKIALSLRAISNTNEYANKACKKEIDKLNNSKEVCSCNICMSNKDVVCVGSNKGMEKWKCTCSLHEKAVYFSTSTSYEAIEIYRKKIVDNLCLFTHTNSVIDGIELYNETSKYFVKSI